MKSLVYRTSVIEDIVDSDSKLNFILWKPSLVHLTPSNKNLKYVVYWLFHMLKVFNNSSYSSVLVYDGDLIVASLLVVPAYYKWPFMKRNDVQFTYVLTSKKYRGQGLAKRMISFAANNINTENCWYVTNKSNLASIKVAEGMGFKIVGTGVRVGLFKKIILN